MKRLKFGFSVVELVVAIAIVGTVALLIVPMSVSAFNKHQSGVVLGRVVEQILQGNQNMLQLANMNNEDGSYTDELKVLLKKDLYPNTTTNADENVWENFQDYICPYWNLNPTKILSNQVINIKKFNGAYDNTITPVKYITDTNCHRFDFKNFIASVAIYRTNNKWFIYVDTTGLTNPPNILGKDIFAFELNNDGTLRPFEADDSNGLQYTEQVVREGFRITYY